MVIKQGFPLQNSPQNLDLTLTNLDFWDYFMEKDSSLSRITHTRPRGYKKNSCSTQLRKKCFLLRNVKMSTMFGILTFISRKNSILGLSELEKNPDFLITYEHLKCHAELS